MTKIPCEIAEQCIGLLSAQTGDVSFSTYSCDGYEAGSNLDSHSAR